MTEKKGLLTAMEVVREADELMIISEEGVVIRTPVEDVSQLGRSTQGVRVMNVAEEDKVTAVAIATDSTKEKSSEDSEDVETDFEQLESGDVFVDEGADGEDVDEDLESSEADQ